MIMAEVGRIEEVNTPEMTGGGTMIGGTYSNAPISELDPCGLTLRSKSALTAAIFMPVSIPGPPACT